MRGIALEPKGRKTGEQAQTGKGGALSQMSVIPLRPHVRACDDELRLDTPAGNGSENAEGGATLEQVWGSPNRGGGATKKVRSQCPRGQGKQG